MSPASLAAAVLDGGALPCCAAGLLLPFIGLLGGMSLYKRRCKLTVFVAAIVLAIMEGACAEECLRQVYQGSE